MSESNGLMGRVTQAFAELSERERKLLAVMVVVLSIMALTLVTYLTSIRLADANDRIEDQREALALLATQREAFLENSAITERINDQVNNNSVRLSTFIEGRARQARLNTPRSIDDGQTPRTDVVLHTATAEFTGVELEQFQNFMELVEQSDELVFTHQIELAPSRRGGGMDLSVTVGTFKRGSEGSR